MIIGVVVHGRALGRTIGFPTANVEPTSGVPKGVEMGVYVCRVGWGGGREKWWGVVSVGAKPTVEKGGKISVECFVMDFQGDLYGHEIQLEILHKLRGIQKFSSLTQLKAQIGMDVARAREIIPTL